MKNQQLTRADRSECDPVDGLYQINSDSCRPSLKAEIILKAADLMYALMQGGHDADVATVQPSPIHEVPLVAEEVAALDAEVGRDRP